MTVRTAMVLAAGHGKRMRPLSEVLPKPALPLPGGPVIAWPLRLADRYAEHLVVNTWHLAEQMVQALDRVDLDHDRLKISPENELMGTAGGLALAHHRGLLPGDPILVINGDVVLDLELDNLLDQHHRHGNLITLALLRHPDPNAWSQVICHEGRVAAFLPAGAPTTAQALLYPGVMLVSQRALASLPVVAGDTMPLLWRPAMAEGRLGGVEVSGQWREVGTPAAYLDAVYAQLAGRPDIDPAATVADPHSLHASYVGPETLIETGTTITASVISHGAVVHSGATVTRSVLLGKVEVAAGTTVNNQLLTSPLPCP